MNHIESKESRIVASDYKGKWFVLEDGETGDAPHIDIEWATGEGLPEHVENCLYYGIPAYIGANQELHDRIKRIEADFDAA